MAIEVDSSEYWRVHGRLPRGRGLWLFQIGQQAEASRLEHYGALAGARAAARREARRLGADYVKVLP